MLNVVYLVIRKNNELLIVSMNEKNWIKLSTYLRMDMVIYKDKYKIFGVWIKLNAYL